VRRRGALAGLLAACAAPQAFAQSARKTVAILFPLPESDAETASRKTAFVSGLRSLGWQEGRNLRLEVRHAVGDAELRRYVSELASLEPSVILIHSNLAMAAAHEQRIPTPTVFVAVSDPVGSGFVADLARPGSNVTGFTNYTPQSGGKWLEVLKEIAPRVESAIVIANSAIAANRELVRAVESAARSLGMVATSIAVSDGGAIASSIARIAGDRTGLVVLPNPTTTSYYRQIIDAAARHAIPAIYPFAFFARSGGLAAYGVDLNDIYERAAAYVDRILRGAQAGDLPVQQPTKYQLLINLRTARVLGLTVPGALLVRADEVIE
jgi:putative tryptophan/tyrosine transport system substrate-binding protein